MDDDNYESSCINIFITDGDAGPRNIKVDIQRNRILATLAIDEAEALADKGIS